MPVLRFKQERLTEVLGTSLAEALELLEKLKAEATLTPDGYVEVELEVDRPDLYTVEGLRRAAKGLWGVERGVPRYPAEDSGVTVEAHSVPVRPIVAAAVVWGVNVDEDYLEELIQFQEKLHNSHGRNREWVAIGLHDYDKLPSRRIIYRFDPIDEVRFQPLDHDKVMSLREVLEETEQGRKYGRISLADGRHPVLYSGSEVISVPPVINAELTRVEPGTRNIFIDVTGVHERLVANVLAVLVANMAERGGRIGLVRVATSGGAVKTTPDLEPRLVGASVSRIARWLGIELAVEEAVDALERARFSIVARSGDGLDVAVPAYRFDVLGWVDLAEEIAVVLGTDRVKPRKPKRLLRGRLLVKRYWERYARQVLVGLGYQELYTYTLTSCERQERVLGMRRDEMIVLANPVSVELDCLRSSLIPGLLEAARINLHNVPLRVFEIGEVVVVNPARDTWTETQSRIGILYMAYKAGYEDIQATVYTLIRSLDDEIAHIEPYDAKPFLPGRAARITTRTGIKGVLGEVDPEILVSLGIDHPVALAELDYTSLQPKQLGQ